MKKDYRGTESSLEWVIPGVLANGMRPGYPNITVDPKEVRAWLAEIQQQRIASIISLLSEDELAVYYRRLDQPLIQYYADAGLVARHIAPEEMGVPVPKQVMLARIRAAFAALPKPVLIHCSSGGERAKEAAEAIRKVWYKQLKNRPLARRNRTGVRHG